MLKVKSILSYFLCWLILGLICFISINKVFAEEVTYSNATFRVKECGNNEWSNWTNATQKLSIYSVNRLGLRLYFNNTTLNANTYYNISVTYNFYSEAPSISVMNSYGKTTFYYNTTASENGNIQGNNNNYSVRFEKDTENTNLIKAVYNVLVPVNSKFIAFNINWDEPNKETCRTLSDGFTISNIKVESLNDTQAIVDGNNANTENIINNNNQNTQDIINNQNQNNDELKDTIKDQFNTCRDSYNKFDVEKWVNSGNNSQYYSYENGELSINAIDTRTLESFTEQDKIYLPNGIYYLSNISPATIRIYNNNTNTTVNTNRFEVTLGYIYLKLVSSNVIKIKPMINEGNTPLSYEPYGQQICSNKLDQTNDKLDNLGGALTDSSPTDMSGLGDSAGWLPAGPVDSILTLPLTMLNNLVNNLSSGSCQTVVLRLPFVDKNINLPCLKTIYDKIGITGTLFQSAGLIASAFILFNYLLKLYQWVDATLTMRENTMPGYFDDNWGGGA